eukprot:6232040-Prymnesium_polylepis.1
MAVSSCHAPRTKRERERERERGRAARLVSPRPSELGADREPTQRQHGEARARADEKDAHRVGQVARRHRKRHRHGRVVPRLALVRRAPLGLVRAAPPRPVDGRARPR